MKPIPTLRKPTKPSLMFFYSVLGMSYFNAFSSIDLNPMLRSYLVSVPIQVGLVIYLIWFRRNPIKP